MKYVLSLTIPQLKILSYYLNKINKAENGGDKEEEKVMPNTDIDNNRHVANRMAFGQTIDMLKKRTGRESFTLSEINDPAATIKKYNKVKK